MRTLSRQVWSGWRGDSEGGVLGKLRVTRVEDASSTTCHSLPCRESGAAWNEGLKVVRLELGCTLVLHH